MGYWKRHAEREISDIVFVMKKYNPTRLIVRCETIRALATLELARVVGGDTELATPTFTCAIMCPDTTNAKPAAS